MDQLMRQLQCPNCKQYMKPPILQCVTGHNVCAICRTNLPKCPLCSGLFTNVKNIALEDLANNARCFPCVNANLDCLSKLSLAEKDAHERNCKASQIPCPIEKCDWTGRFDEISKHWLSKQMKLKPYKADNVCHTKINREKESYYTNMVEVYDRIFFFKCMSSEGKFFWAVQYVGNVQEAERYYYEIEIFKPGRWKNKFILSSYCQGINLKNADLFKEGVCTFTPITLLNAYMNVDNALIYYLRVKCVDESEVSKHAKVVNNLIKHNRNKEYYANQKNDRLKNEFVKTT